MITTANFKNGVVFEWDNVIWQLVWFQHHKPGKGGAMVRVKIKNLKAGSIIERTFKSGEKFKEVSLNRRRKQYVYTDGNAVHFMDSETYEDMAVDKEQMGDQVKFLMDEMQVDAVYLDGEFLNIELPASVKLKVSSTVPGVKGNSATNIMKPATLETGLEVDVPLFINEGDTIKVDTRTKEYMERV